MYRVIDTYACQAYRYHPLLVVVVPLVLARAYAKSMTGCSRNGPTRMTWS